jgi:uncharacterized RDD family membrane protein YckC
VGGDRTDVTGSNDPTQRAEPTVELAEPYPGSPPPYPGPPPYPTHPQTGTAPYPPPFLGPPRPVPPGHYFDPQSGLIMPDGTELASVGRRIGGYFLDTLLFFVTLGIGYLVWTLIVWKDGLTPAKQLLNMRCYRTADDRPAHWGWMAMRQVVGGGIVEGFIIFVFIASCIMMVASKDRRAIHDHLAGTIVLYDPEKRLKSKA